MIDVDAEYEKAIARADKLYENDLARLEVNKEKGQKMKQEYEDKTAREIDDANAKRDAAAAKLDEADARADERLE